MALRLYMDHDSLDRRVIDALRAAGVDVVTSDEAGNQRLTDHAQLELSTRAGRVLYSANCRDFARIHTEWAKAERQHGGILLRSNQRMSIGAQVRALRQICETVVPEPGTSLFAYVDHWV